jgi:O-antigen/teichoic acid export membrane protein
MNHSLKLNFNNLTLKVKKLVKSSTPFFKINLSSVIINNSDIIIIGALVDPIKVGFYVVASKLALFTSFFLQSSMSSILPKISSLYHDNKLNELQFFLKKINLLFITLSLIIFPTYVLFGKFFLSIWGNEFESSYYVLIILAAGQTFNLATGPVGGVLTMTVYERLQSKISMISAVFNLILTFLLVSKFGIIGAAFSTAFNIMLINLIKIFIVRHKLKFKFF